MLKGELLQSGMDGSMLPGRLNADKLHWLHWSNLSGYTQVYSH